MNLKKSLLALTILISVNYVDVLAQQQTDTTKRVVFFNSPSKSKVVTSNEDNIIKIAPLGLLSGRIPILYERKVTDFLSLQASAGLTTRNYIRFNTSDNELGDFKTSYSPLADEADDKTDELYNYDHRKAKLGYMVGIQPRIYFESDGLEGSYIGVSFEFLKFNYETPNMVKNNGSYSYSNNKVKEFESYNELMINYGLQRIYDNLTLDYGAAIGIRNLKGEKYVAGDVNSNFVDGLAKYNKSAVNFNVFFRVGYHF